jgi:hypothetical protein
LGVGEGEKGKGYRVFYRNRIQTLIELWWLLEIFQGIFFGILSDWTNMAISYGSHDNHEKHLENSTERQLGHAFSTVSHPTTVYLVFPEVGNLVHTPYIGEYHDQRVHPRSHYRYVPWCCPPPF